MAKEKKQFRQLSDEELEKVTGGLRFCIDRDKVLYPEFCSAD